MSDTSRPTKRVLARMVRQKMESLRAAGVEWLPAEPLSEAKRQRLMEWMTPEAEGPISVQTMQAVQAVQTVSEAPPADLEGRRQALSLLAAEVSRCTRCAGLAATRTQTVFGVGPVGAELCFVGEAPGADEDAQGEPFVGAAGQLLTRIIIACKLNREDVYICNIIKCRPPGNRTPQPDEAANCREYLERQIDLVRPKFICALGGCAAHNLLKTTESLGKLRGRFHDYRGIPVMVTYHPAYLLPHRSPDKKKDVWEDMKWLMARMGRPVE